VDRFFALRNAEGFAPRLAVVVALASLGMLPLAQAAEAQLPQAGAGALLDELSETIPELLDEHGVSGFAVGMVEDGQVRFTAGYGCAECESGRPVTDSTLFNVASLSKSATAWGVVHLAETHSLDLDASLGNQVEQGLIPTGARAEVTLRQLLSHTAGLSMPSVPWFPADSVLPTREAVLRGQAGDRGALDFIHEPGSRWAYSRGGYLLLEPILEQISGQRFPDYLSRKGSQGRPEVVRFHSSTWLTQTACTESSWMRGV
jgi:CubicO group peptidase (beta-lactamase class C family)